MIVKNNQTSTNKKIQFCPYCGAKLLDDARFCTVCGEKIISDSQDQFTEGRNPSNGDHAQEDSVNHGNYQDFSYEDVDDEQSDYDETYQKTGTRQTVYEGKIHKCPNCGEVLESFVTRCPTCGYEIRSTKSTSSVEELSQKLERISSRTIQGKYTQKDFQEFEEEKDKEQASLITNYSVPNTKEDILEFIILASSGVKNSDWNHNYEMDAVSKAWLSKMEQAYQKAEIVLNGQPELQQIEQIYKGKMDDVNLHKMTLPLIWAVIIGMFLFMMGLLSLITGNTPIIFVIGILYFVALAAVVVFIFRKYKD